MGFYRICPLVNINITMENHNFSMGTCTTSMAIFNSYVKRYQRVYMGIVIFQGNPVLKQPVEEKRMTNPNEFQSSWTIENNYCMFRSWTIELWLKMEAWELGLTILQPFMKQWEHDFAIAEHFTVSFMRCATHHHRGPGRPAASHGYHVMNHPPVNH